MNGNDRIQGDQNSLLDTLAAELTDAAYSVALRRHKPASWLDLELDLWRALRETVHTSERFVRTSFLKRSTEP